MTSRVPVLLIFACTTLVAADELTISPPEVTLVPQSLTTYTPLDKSVTFTVKFGSMALVPSTACIFSPTTASTWTPAFESDNATVRAPAAFAQGITQLTVDLVCTHTDSAGTMHTKTAAITIASAKNNEWESRAIIGYHQAGASSAKFDQNFFMDFFVTRGIGSHEKVYDNAVNLWGNVRIASSPQQVTTSIESFAATFATQAGNVKVNELAMSAEYQAGLEVRIRRFNQGNRVRMLGGIAFLGANGSFEEPSSHGTTLVVPDSTSQKYDLFREHFPSVLASGAKYVAFLPPDRQRFYRFYGTGLRLSTFERDKPYAPPATFTWTLGQDELITGGSLHGVVSRVDVFYPLPMGMKDGRWKFLFLFGTVNKWWHRDPNDTPLVLQEANENDTPIPVADPRVAIVTVRNNRDTYRIGFGVDLVNIVNSWLGK